MSLTVLKAAKTRQQNAMEAYYPGSFLWAGVSYPSAITRGAGTQVPAGDGSGFRPMQTVSISVKKTLLPTPPPDGAMLTIDSKSWRVESVAGHDAAEVVWHLSAVHFPRSS